FMKSMKKSGILLLSLLVLSLMAFLTGCGSKTESGPQEVTEAAAPATAPAETQGNEAAKIIEVTNAYLTSGKAATISAADVFNNVVVGKDPGYYLVEIRKPEDYAKGHVPGAVQINYGDFYKQEVLDKLPKDKKIVVICYTGHTASQITLLLNQLGYDAYAMKFGMMGWTTDEKVLAIKGFAGAANYPLETKVNEAQPTNELPQVATGKADTNAITLAQTEKYLTSGKSATISVQDVFNNVVTGKDPGYVLLSVRKAEDYAKGHVPGAINIPLGQLAKEENLKKLPPDKKIVVICYTGHTASQATMFLNQLGYDAYAMKFGMMGWTSDENVLALKPFTKAPGYQTTAGTNP
ncbi:MAG TPA: rhodanese-like domain-containing protein, partial [Bacillota bacterium]|nr:rhodanese-like domain-containing protein [Bacillota bacterium]